MTDLKYSHFPIFKDNYQYIFSSNAKAVVVDPGDATKILIFLDQHQLELEAILVTHVHDDHIDGLETLLQKYPDIKVFGSLQSLKYLKLPLPVSPTQRFEILGHEIEVIPTPGHTREQVAFYIPEDKVVFTGDLIFHLGCGRVFDGTIEEQFESLKTLKSLPDETKILCSHDYGLVNLNFFLKQSPPYSSLANYPYFHKIPLILGEEKKWNPFLTDSIEEFTRLRKLRNQF